MDKAPLSTLIRIGSKLRPQGFHWLVTENGNTCALGAAYMAKYGEEPSAFSVNLNKALNIDDYWIDEITLRNDTFRKTREEIADWLESQGL